MGVVYKAEDTKLGRTVALKFLAPHLLRDPDARTRFEREARAAAALDHPNICTVHEIDEFDGQTFIALAFLDGKTLSAKIAQGPLKIPEALSIATQLAEGLAAAHEQGVIHRDMKPDNVMLVKGSRGLAKIMDFGLAQLTGASKLTREGTTLGTISYMSPEQAEGAETDHRSDIWSFGVILYEMVAGQAPFRGEFDQAVVYSILNEAPEPLTAVRAGVPQELERIVGKCLAKQPDQRYQTADDLPAELITLKQQVESGAASDLEAVEARAPKPRRAFVGREAETTELRQLLERTRGGSGSLVLIGGEPGVGKTRLCEEILADAGEQQMLVLTGASYEGEGVQSFIPFVESVEAASRAVPRGSLRAALGDAAPEIAKLMPELRRIFHDIPDPIQLPAEQQQRYLFNGFREFLQRLSRQAPVVWLLDDLHWADDSSLLLLHHLAQSVERLPVLILGTYRDVELEVGKPFEKALSQLVRQHLAQRIALRRLPQASVAELLESLGGAPPPESLVEAIYHETEGNPFFVEEVFQHLSEEDKLFDQQGRWKSDLGAHHLEVPEGVRLVIGRRLERLSPETPKILSAAAIIGRVFELGTLEALEGFDPDEVLDAIEEAEAAKLVAPVAAGREAVYRFTHELIRHTLVVGLSIRRRQRTHLLIADALEKRGAENVSSLAHHLYEAGVAADLDKTIHYLKLAGEREVETGACKEALGHVDAALSLLEDESPEIRADLLFLKGRAEYTLVRTKEALASRIEASRLYTRLGDAQGVARCAGEIFLEAMWRAEYEGVTEVVREALAMTEGDATPERCLIMAAAGAFLSGFGDCDSTPRLLEDAVTVAEGIGDSALLGEVLHHKIVSNWAFMTGPQMVEDGERARDALRSAGDLWHFAAAASYLKVGLVFASRLKEAGQRTEGDDVAEQLGHVAAQGTSRIGREFGGFIRSGNIDELQHFAEWYRDWNEAAGYPWSFISHAHLGLCEFWRGNWDDFHKHFQRGLEIEEGQASGWYSWGNYFMAMAYAGNPGALELLERKRSMFPKVRPYNTNGQWIALMRTIEGLAVMGRREEAAEFYPLAQLCTETGTLVEFFSTVMPQLPAGISAACGRNWAAAEEHYQTGLRQAQEMPHPIAQADIRRWYAQMLLDRNESGDPERATEMLTEAMAQYRELGMPKHFAITERIHAPLAR